MILNPHLAGDSFFWPGNSIGILLSHGFPATTAEVRPIAQLLHSQGYSVAGPLLPGHKTTPDDLNRYRWQDWLEAVEQAYQQLATRCERVFVGGELMGGTLALYLAGRHPEIAGLLTYSPAIRLAFLRRSLVRLLAPFLAHVYPPRRSPRPVVDAVWQGYAVRPTRATLQLLSLMEEVNRRLPKIQQPTLIVQGRLDTTVDPHGADLLYRRVGSAVKEMHWMEKSSHCVMLDQEQPQVAALTLQFIERVLGG